MYRPLQKLSPKNAKLREVLLVARAGSDIMKPDSASNKQTTFSAKKGIGMKLEELEKMPRKH